MRQGYAGSKLAGECKRDQGIARTSPVHQGKAEYKRNQGIARTSPVHQGKVECKRNQGIARTTRQCRSQSSSSAKEKPKSQDCRSHKCKRDQGIVRTSLVHQDDDLACDHCRSHKLPKSLARLLPLQRETSRPLPREPLGRVTCEP
ncbi:unnamed protein product [Cochlearia groenlandica]